MRRRAKIVCTIGPATRSPETVRALVDAGMDVARLNLSHGTHEEHADVYRAVREASDVSRRAVGVLADLQGPKLRLGSFETGSALLQPGSTFTLTTGHDEEGNGLTPGTAKLARASYGDAVSDLALEVAPGDTLLIDDGLVKLRALSSDGRLVSCRVEEGGLVSDHKGINLPGLRASGAGLTAKDLDDLRFALYLGADLVAMSFVAGPQDAVAAHQVMEEVGRRVPLIAKLERLEAVENLGAIIEAFDGLMVARGDLGVESPLEQVPLVQKRAVRLAREQAKPVIVATQMLESMGRNPRPTRAEVSDVANAVLDGADALMLSAETSVGSYPLAATTTMARIISTTEQGGSSSLAPLAASPEHSVDAITMAAAQVARSVDAKALVAFTQTGRAARRLASHRSPLPLLALTPEPAVRSQLALAWGVETFIGVLAADSQELLAQVEHAVLDGGHGRPHDRVVIVAGSPPGEPGTTNMLRVHELGSVPTWI